MNASNLAELQYKGPHLAILTLAHASLRELVWPRIASGNIKDYEGESEPECCTQPSGQTHRIMGIETATMRISSGRPMRQ